ncbi:hypothetical protein [Leifsonia sp. Root112D2]|jgi:hypothetical protein|uniref:hypothetical protein n=1 Tax=Leifsonia sp. Root112D2 TaxID=1736426 RepID=UPI0006FA8238|nr:hypothetical protein [Leifsonia sp. Root112D2]KQV06821.1 hypothetical protein ASC63_05425 [Leifsonia sp. Root112D2]
MDGTGMQRGDGSRFFQPRRRLLSAAWIVWLAFTTPLFFAVYLVTIPPGRWVPFAIAHLALLAAFALGSARLRGAGVLLSADGIREREYFSRMTFTPAENIRAVLIVKVRDSYTDEISQQVFVTDAAGRTLLRLRSPLWHPEDLTAMIDFYDVPVRVEEAEMTWPQLRLEYGGNLQAWERHPALTAAFGILVCTVLMVGAVVAVRFAIG